MHMKKVRITVLKTTLDEELARQYGVPGLTACPMLRAGQVFYADYAKPDGLCDEAWKAIYQYVFALAHGAGEGLFYFGDWIREKGSPSVPATTACARSSSNWKPRTKKRRPATRRCAEENTCGIPKNSKGPSTRAAQTCS